MHTSCKQFPVKPFLGTCIYYLNQLRVSNENFKTIRLGAVTYNWLQLLDKALQTDIL